MGYCLQTDFTAADRFNQSESQCHGKSNCSASCTFCPGESCNRLEVFPHPLLLYLICPSRSLPRWACPPLASCPFPPFLAFLSSFQRNAEPERVMKSFSEERMGHISLRQSQSKVENQSSWDRFHLILASDIHES